jgi:hypothetical protein
MHIVLRDYRSRGCGTKMVFQHQPATDWPVDPLNYLQSSAYDFITVLDSIIGRLKVFQPDLLDNYVYLQILSSFKQAPLNRAIVINMQQSADGDSGDESPKRPSVLILVRGLQALS